MEALAFTSPIEKYHEQAEYLLSKAQLRDAKALRFMNLGENDIAKNDFTLQDAEDAILNWYHFKSWQDAENYIQSVREQPAFEEAVEAIISGDTKTLFALLQKNPELIHARSIRWHRATLLTYVGANGVEDFRQKTPPNAVEICKILLDAGADVNATAEMYGGGATTFGLVATSIWPAKTGVLIPLLELLLSAGASIGTDERRAVVGCLANGRPEAADALVRFGASLDLEGAAGVGRLDEVKTYFDNDGHLKDASMKEQMEKGFIWACEFGHTAVVKYLLDAGIHPDMQVDGMAGMHWAVIGAHLDMVELLINRGADMENENRFGGTVLEAALWATIHSDPVYRWPSFGTDYPTVIETILKAGAKVRTGVLDWLNKTDELPEDKKQPIRILLEKYSA